MLVGEGFTHSRPRAVPSRTSPPHLGQKARFLAGGLRSRFQVTASAAARSLSAVSDQIFYRKEELAALNLRFANNPKDMLILSGPANCGKTRLLKEVKEIRDAAQATKGDAPPPILYLDCRKKDISSPQGFASVIRELVDEDPGLKEWWKGINVNLPHVEADLGKIFEPAADKSPMASIIDSLITFLEATRHLPNKPVIIIDEANVLMEWSDDPGHKQLKHLLRFFVWATKQEHLGHILLGSAEYFLVEYLENEGLRTKNYVTQVIGDLATIDEAKQYVESRMRCRKAPPSFFDTTKDGKQIDMWPQVYEVCGGNIGLLERCAGYAKNEGSWEEGLKTVSKDPEDAVQKGLWPEDFFCSTSGSRSPPSWTQEDYKTVLREIALAKEHKHAVSFDKLRNMLSKGALRSMVEWNLVALRRKSSWAKDLPETLFTDLDDTKLVTMPSPVELYFVLKMHEAGELDAASDDDGR